MPEQVQAASHPTSRPREIPAVCHGGTAAARSPGQPGDCANRLLFDHCRWPIFTRAGKPEDYPQPTPIGVHEAGARAADPIDPPQRNSPIDIDRNLSACLHPARAGRGRIIIRICTDNKINAVDKP
jgi:hypothetical protein